MIELAHGHESTTKYKIGDKVVCYAILGCGDCFYCQDTVPTNYQSKAFVEGGFQEYSIFNESLFFPCPEDIDFIAASLLSDAIGVSLRVLRRLKPEKNDKVCA